MPIECIERPELKAPVLGLIAGVSKSHAGGAFKMALADIFKTFGLTLEASEWSKLQGRGEVNFSPQADALGSFVNAGDELQIETGEGLTMVVPAKLAGEYVTTSTSLTLKFAEGAALRGCKRVFVLICQDVIKIDADEHKLYLDLPGEKYDLCFIF
ncbi:MAG: hypothetical protein ABR577_12750 [Pyrinomonadaceae bacterium]